jgi:hypothetical protein
MARGTASIGLTSPIRLMHLSAGNQLVPRRARCHAEDLDFESPPARASCCQRSPRSSAAAGEMRIRVEASGVNFAPTFGAASATMHGELRALGIDHLIAYRTEDFKALASRSQADAGSSSSSTPSAEIHRRGTSFHSGPQEHRKCAAAAVAAAKAFCRRKSITFRTSICTRVPNGLS